ncbi:unnamed protein product [Psylliodes chrysocephalus]|uniref:Uncharacterized protein n=1 Tax=Psylliodes chrysocephalus TaxID=3402493 RepID=A0A9P0CD49_9CUCU|nr:unnamed protein product [Psylliodes chrysocephala]
MEALVKDVQVRHNHLLKEKKKIKDFGDEVFEAEQSFVDKINNERKISANALEELKEVKQFNAKINKDLELQQVDLNNQRKYVKELEEIGRNMVESVRILEKEKKLLEKRLIEEKSTVEHIQSPLVVTSTLGLI